MYLEEQKSNYFQIKLNESRVVLSSIITTSILIKLGYLITILSTQNQEVRLELQTDHIANFRRPKIYLTQSPKDFGCFGYCHTPVQDPNQIRHSIDERWIGSHDNRCIPNPENFSHAFTFSNELWYAFRFNREQSFNSALQNGKMRILKSPRVKVSHRTQTHHNLPYFKKIYQSI